MSQDLPTSNTGSIVARLRAAAVGDRLALAIIQGAPEYTGIADDAADEIEALNARLQRQIEIAEDMDQQLTDGMFERKRLRAALERIAKLDGMPTTVGSPNGYKGVADALAEQIMALQDIAVKCLAGETGANDGK